MSRAVYEQFRVQVKQEILQKLDCGLDFSDGQVRRLIDERLCRSDCIGRLDVVERRKLGRELFAAIRAGAIARGYRLLQVKTVQTGHYAEYDRTNAFYQRMGFLPLECLPTLWDEWNPCQVYVLPLQNS